MGELIINQKFNVHNKDNEMNIINPYRYVSGGLDLPLGNIIHQYDFDGDSTDAVGSKDGTDTNMTYSTGLGDNKSAVFDGTAYIDLPNDMSSAAPEFTYSCLVKSNNTSTEGRCWTFDYTNDGFVTFRVNPLGVSNRVDVAVRRSNATTIIINSDSYTVSNWNHFAVTIDRDGAVIFYMNGTSIGSDTISPSTNLGTLGTLTNVFGADRNYGRRLDGEIAACKVWDAILTPTEASTLATAELAGTKVN